MEGILVCTLDRAKTRRSRSLSSIEQNYKVRHPLYGGLVCICRAGSHPHLQLHRERIHSCSIPQTTTNSFPGSFTLPAALGDNTLQRGDHTVHLLLQRRAPDHDQRKQRDQIFQSLHRRERTDHGLVHLPLHGWRVRQRHHLTPSSVYGGGIVCGVCDFVSNVNSGESARS